MNGHLAKPVSLPALREALDRRIPPILDDALLDELADSLGGRALVDQMLEVYRSCLPERLQNLRAADTPEALKDAAHALRSPSAGFGIARLAARLHDDRGRRARRPDRRARARARRRRAHRSRARRTLERFLTDGRARLDSPRRSKGHEAPQA